MNEAREKTDEIIDVLHGPLVGKSRRPRTYRQTATREFTAFIRKKKPSRNVIRKAVRKQLGYLRRNLDHIERLLQNPEADSLSALSRRLYKLLLVCHEVSRQQRQMYDAKAIRNTVEGKFGQAKRRFGLARVMAKLATASAAQISLSFLVMNLETALRRLVLAFLFLLTRRALPTRGHHPSI